MDGTDESVSLIGTGVTLSRHMDGVGERAGRVAESLGLSEEIAEDLRLAGRLHDLGKVDRRFRNSWLAAIRWNSKCWKNRWPNHFRELRVIIAIRGECAMR